MNFRWFAFAIVLGSCSQDVCIEEWCWQNPLPQGNHLRAVHAFAPDDVWVAGDVGTVLRWNGARWARIETNPFENDQPGLGYADWTITSLWGSASDDLWATTRWGRGILHWDGATWSQVQDQQGNPRGRVVRGTARDDVWTVEENGATWRWDGKAWLPVSSPGLRNSIAARAKDDVWTAGYGGFAGSLAHWDGSMWTSVVPEADAGPREYTGILSFGPSDVWVLGPAGLLRGDGATWIVEPSPLAPPVTMVADDPRLHGTSPSDVWAWQPADQREGAITHWNGAEWTPFQGLPVIGLGGSGPADVWTAGWRGDLQHWDGAKWKSSSSNLGEVGHLISIGGSSSADVWAFGVRGLALHWDGKRWSRVDIGRTDTLVGVWGAASDDLWAVGAGVVLHFDGSTWSEVSGFDHTFEGVCGTASNDVWLHGRSALFHWDGSTWSDFHSRGGSCSVAGRNDVWFAHGRLTHWDGAELKDVDFGGDWALSVWALTGSDVWAIDGQKTYHWDGKSWKERLLPSSLPFHRSVQILGVASDDVWALTDQQLFHWKGDRWTQIPPFLDPNEPGVMWASGGSMWLVGSNGAILRRR